MNCAKASGKAVRLHTQSTNFSHTIWNIFLLIELVLFAVCIPEVLQAVVKAQCKQAVISLPFWHHDGEINDNGKM